MPDEKHPDWISVTQVNDLSEMSKHVLVLANQTQGEDNVDIAFLHRED